MATQEAIYQQAHRNIVKARGRAENYICRGFLARCDKPAREWAFIERGLGSFQVTVKDTKDGRVYTNVRTVCMDPMSYTAMCKSCHKRMDQHLASLLEEVAA